MDPQSAPAPFDDIAVVEVVEVARQSRALADGDVANRTWPFADVGVGVGYAGVGQVETPGDPVSEAAGGPRRLATDDEDDQGDDRQQDEQGR